MAAHTFGIVCQRRHRHQPLQLDTGHGRDGARRRNDDITAGGKAGLGVLPGNVDLEQGRQRCLAST